VGLYCPDGNSDIYNTMAVFRHSGGICSMPLNFIRRLNMRQWDYIMVAMWLSLGIAGLFVYAAWG